MEAFGKERRLTSDAPQVKPDELKEIIGAYKDTSKVYADGLHVAGQRYIVIKADSRSIYGKQVPNLLAMP